MPHITLDYSANLEDRVDMGGLCDALRRAAIATGVFPMAGIRVRALRADHVSIADGNPAHGYVDISVRLRGGRDTDTRKAVTDALFQAAEGFLASTSAAMPLALSLELRDIDPAVSPKSNTIRSYLKGGPENV